MRVNNCIMARCNSALKPGTIDYQLNFKMLFTPNHQMPLCKVSLRQHLSIFVSKVLRSDCSCKVVQSHVNRHI